MKRFFTSDLHLFHTNIVTYCRRPWPSMEAMHIGLVHNWNSVVRPEDEVFVLGDFSFGNEELTTPICNQLHGKRYLVPGNHDRRGKAQYDRLGFTLLEPGHRLTLATKIPVILHHYPYGTRDHTAVPRDLDKRPIDDGHTWLLHGHVHNSFLMDDRCINVGVDAWDYFPIDEAAIVTLIENCPQQNRHMAASNPFDYNE